MTCDERSFRYIVNRSLMYLFSGAFLAFSFYLLKLVLKRESAAEWAWGLFDLLIVSVMCIMGLRHVAGILRDDYGLFFQAHGRFKTRSYIFDVKQEHPQVAPIRGDQPEVIRIRVQSDRLHPMRRYRLERGKIGIARVSIRVGDRGKSFRMPCPPCGRGTGTREGQIIVRERGARSGSLSVAPLGKFTEPGRYEILVIRRAV